MAVKRQPMPKASRKKSAFRVCLLAFVKRSRFTTGYEISNRLHGPSALLWPMSHSQIYPTLSELEAEGLIIGKWSNQSGKPDKKNYSVTPAATEEVNRWLIDLAEPLTHEEVLACSYCLGMGDPLVIAEKLRDYRASMELEIRELEERRRSSTASADPHFQAEPDNFAILTLYRLADAERRTQIQWIDWVLGEMLDGSDRGSADLAQ